MINDGGIYHFIYAFIVETFRILSCSVIKCGALLFSILTLQYRSTLSCSVLPAAVPRARLLPQHPWASPTLTLSPCVHKELP